jgi:hypothetical protein
MLPLQQENYKKKKGGSEKANAAAETRVNKTKSKCSHCSRNGHNESSCWKKYLHKAPSKSSTEASGSFLDEELLVCNIEVNDTYYVTENSENAYYCVPITEGRQQEDLASWMGLVKSLMG